MQITFSSWNCPWKGHKINVQQWSNIELVIKLLKGGKIQHIFIEFSIELILINSTKSSTPIILRLKGTGPQLVFTLLAIIYIYIFITIA